MSIFDLLPYTDSEIDSIIAAVRAWGKRTSTDMGSASSLEALGTAIAAVRSRNLDHDAIVEHLCNRHPAQIKGDAEPEPASNNAPDHSTLSGS